MSKPTKQPPIAAFQYECFGCFGHEVGLDVLHYSRGRKLYDDVVVDFGFYSKRSVLRMMWALGKLVVMMWRDLILVS